MNDRMEQYTRRKAIFAETPSIATAQALSVIGLICWQDGEIGDATYVREVLEPVRSYLLAGNTPLPEGHGQSAKIIVPETRAPFLAPPPGEREGASDVHYLLSIIDGLEEATGEGPDGEDRALVEQIRRDYAAPAQPVTGTAPATPTPEDRHD